VQVRSFYLLSLVMLLISALSMMWMNLTEINSLIATGIFIAATLLALLYAWFKQRRVPPMLIVTAVIVTFFGGLTLAFHDAIFIKIKPTIINLLYAAAIFGSLMVGRNIWKLLLNK